MQDQPTDETPQQSVQPERGAEHQQVRQVAESLRAGLAEDERLAEQTRQAQLMTEDEH